MPTQSSKSSYVFLIRAFNDLDHILPLIARVASSSCHRAEVFCIEPRFDYHASPHVAYLKEIGVTVQHFHRKAAPWRRALCGLLQATLNLALKVFPASAKPVCLLRQGIYSITLRDGQLPARIIHKNVDALLVDWSKTTKYPLNHFVARSRQRGIPVVSLPHGILMFEDNPNPSKVQPHAYDFNAVLTCGPPSVKYFTIRGVDFSRIHDLGNMRFSDGWSRRWRQFLTSTCDRDSTGSRELPVRDGMLRIALFLRKGSANKVDLLGQAFAALGGIPNSIVAIKVNTRDNSLDPSLLKSLPSNFRLVPQDVSSIDLIDWSQACVNYGSSIAYEIFLQEKPHLHLDFLVPGVTYDYVTAGAALVVRAPEEIPAAMEQIRNHPGQLPYSPEAVDQLLTTNVYGGEPGDVVERYFQFIGSLCSGAASVPTAERSVEPHPQRSVMERKVA